MRIYNATNSCLSLPLTSTQNLTISAKSVSANFLGTKEFLSSVITCLSSDQIAIVVSGPYEIRVCSEVPTAVNYVVQSLDEAIMKFNKKEEPKEEVILPKEEEEKVEEETVAEPETETTEKPEVEEPVEVETEQPKKAKKTKKSKKSE